MSESDASSGDLRGTILGGSLGIVIALSCWIVLFILASFDDAAHWKATLILFGILLPIGCVAGGVIVFRLHEGRPNFIVANVGFGIIATILTTATIISVFSLSIWWGMLLLLPIFLGWAFVVEHYVSAIINSIVERLAGPPL